MAQLSLGEARWRILRLALRHKQFQFNDVRTWTRHDRRHFDWLLTREFIVLVDDETYELTDRGRESADLGFYEFTAPAKAASVGSGRRARK